MQVSAETKPSFWARIKQVFRPSQPEPAADAIVPPPRFLGGFERRHDGLLVINHLMSTDVLFDLGCQAGDVVLALDGVGSQRIPDDLLFGPTEASRVIITRDSVLIAKPASEYGDHPDPTLRQERINELMEHAMHQLRVDPLFHIRNRLEGPPPEARADTIQPITGTPGDSTHV